MTDLQLLILVVILGFLYLGWRIDRLAKTVAASPDVAGYLGEISEEVETIRTLLRAAPALKPGPYKPEVPSSMTGAEGS